jgi:hypothetical protein
VFTYDVVWEKSDVNFPKLAPHTCRILTRISVDEGGVAQPLGHVPERELAERESALVLYHQLHHGRSAPIHYARYHFAPSFTKGGPFDSSTSYTIIILRY